MQSLQSYEVGCVSEKRVSSASEHRYTWRRVYWFVRAGLGGIVPRRMELFGKIAKQSVRLACLGEVSHRHTDTHTDTQLEISNG